LQITNNNFYSIKANQLYLNVTYIPDHPNQQWIYLGYALVNDINLVAKNVTVLPVRVSLQPTFVNTPTLLADWAVAMMAKKPILLNFNGSLTVFHYSLPLAFNMSFTLSPVPT